ncbi:hypothetical protein FDP41_007208 [Naegleria fowleri]|uniref:Glutaredoxin domain-containing protein n=1 Tax=Naegleria fowleri TaxID=5763 RepID=A0A6A5BHA2_NAEFO|nr:uncharacterized protein FDP41_007208 [Naegleria fowleri]KAF0973821.1 hypothetical protein FDP41_007208 [Naegleria fowleri]
MLRSICTKNSINFSVIGSTVKASSLVVNNTMRMESSSVRMFSTRSIFRADESGFHDDFKTVRKPPQQNMKELFDQKKQEVDKIVHSNKVVLFMKGTPERPECGFSGAVVKILSLYNVDYVSYNMNKDVVMKEALKEYSDWPTIPQLFVDGELIGGSDIVLNHHREGTLQEVLEGKKE